MNAKNCPSPKDNDVTEDSAAQKEPNAKGRDEELKNIISKLTDEDPALIAEVIKKWLGENKQ